MNSKCLQWATAALLAAVVQVPLLVDAPYGQGGETLQHQMCLAELTVSRIEKCLMRVDAQVYAVRPAEKNSGR